MLIRSLFLTLSLLLSSNAFADNESLDIDFFEGNPSDESLCISEKTSRYCQFNTYQSCNFLLGIMHETWKSRDNYDALFPNGELPECINNELPDAWVENRTPINRYGQTVCKIPCNVRSLPFMGYPNDRIGHIIGSKKILILEKIEINANLNIYKESPWYNYWYSFNYEGKKLYIHTDNIVFKEKKLTRR